MTLEAKAMHLMWKLVVRFMLLSVIFMNRHYMHYDQPMQELQKDLTNLLASLEKDATQ
jgi:hypothetical protein